MRPNSSGSDANRLFETRSTSIGKKHNSRGSDVSKLLLHGEKENNKIRTTQKLLFIDEMGFFFLNDQLAGFVSCNRNYFHMFFEEVIAI